VSAGDFDMIFAVLQRAGVRYLVVGGVAVVLHGHPRFTADLDLVVALDPKNARAAIEALGVLGYRPRAPVSGALFADPGTVQIPVASLEDLVALKRAAGRPKDLEDVRALEAIASERKDG
jgi:hypothetical protein